MTSFLFWNLMGRDQESWPARVPTLLGHLSRMAATFDVDVFLFAESGFEPAQIVDALNQAKVGKFRYPASRSARIQLVTRLPRKAIVDQFNDRADGRLTIRRLVTKTGTEVLLAATHFQSQLNWTRDAQAQQATVLRETIAQVEDDVGHQRTLLVGDLNMDPFDLGLVGAQCLNAAMDRQTARVGERIVAGRAYRFFYNPMWGQFGDRTPGPAGTYYHGTSRPDAPSWHLFDQVLLRPGLMDQLKRLEVVAHDGQETLLTDRGHPRYSQASDHLPLFFELTV